MLGLLFKFVFVEARMRDLFVSYVVMLSGACVCALCVCICQTFKRVRVRCLRFIV